MRQHFRVSRISGRKSPQRECLLIVEGAKEKVLDLEGSTWSKRSIPWSKRDEEESSNQTGPKTIRPAKEWALCSLPSRVGKVGSRMEIRMAYPNEIQRIMEIIKMLRKAWLKDRSISGRMVIQMKRSFLRDIPRKSWLCGRWRSGNRRLCSSPQGKWSGLY